MNLYSMGQTDCQPDTLKRKEKRGLIGFHEPTESIVQIQTEMWLKGRWGKEGPEAVKAKAGKESRDRKI